MISHLRPAIVATVFFTLLLGVAYPLTVTGIASLAFPFQAGGSMLRDGGRVVGSALVGQPFSEARYLHPRPSAAGSGYDASASSGSNYGPLNPDLIARARADAEAVRAADGVARPPADAVTASASGLDPDISPAYARVQAARIAVARGVPAEQVQAVIEQSIQAPVLGFLGQPKVNVLMTNRLLDRRFPAAKD
ncbi:MAG: potassium-transporting ATPase subunit C [Caulobacterales bacterium 32-69-10]|nr:MAG: potassium-transporting ATPase subunit C [Caulobacterales bacterium 32-69-10]